ncbi:MAG: protein kinase [Myxococcaceae bacterium]
MECPSEKQLAELADGALPATGAARLQAHVDGCDACQKTVRGLVNSEATMLETSLDGRTQLSNSWADSLTLKSLVGEKVGEYRVEEMIGSGGMGVVYRGVHPIIGRPVAIKVLRPELAADAASVEAMLTEARAVASIGHRGIVDVFAYGELPDGRHYMVMELLNGEALNRLIRREAPLPPKRVVELLDAILDSLEAAHEAGVVHRDLKPSNLFVVKQKTGVLVKLLDFGLAKRGVNTGKTNTAVLMGTPGYMAPEQIRLSKTDARTDLYSLGVIAYELATGRRPFKADDMAALLLAHTDQTPAPPSSVAKVPRDLEQWILALLAKTPEERPASAEVVRERLQRLKLQDFASDVDVTELTGKSLGDMLAAQDAITGSNEVPSLPVELPKRNWVPIIGAGAAGVALLFAAIVFATSGEAPTTRTVVELPSPYRKPEPVARTADPKPVEPKPVQAKPNDTPVETKPEPRPAEVRTPVKAKTEGSSASLQSKLLSRVKSVRAKVERGGDADPLALAMVQDAENNVKAASTDDALKKAEKLVRELERRYGH